MAEKTPPKPPAEEIEIDDLQLSQEKLDAIKAQARKQIRAERIKALEARALEQALEELRGKEGQTTGNPAEDELVDITIDLGDSTDRMWINGKPFVQGHTYTVPRHVARTLRETMFRTQAHEHSITDKPLSDFLRKQHHTELSRKGVVRPPAHPVERLH
jgi:hypothetical protein